MNNLSIINPGGESMNGQQSHAAQK